MEHHSVNQHEKDALFLEIESTFPENLIVDPTVFSTYINTRYIVENELPGDIIEFGVFWGKQVYVIASTLLALKCFDRRIFLYDTFSGMPEPGEFDAKLKFDWSKDDVRIKWEKMRRSDHNDWCFSSLEAVRNVVFSSGYPESNFHFVVGDVLDTLNDKSHSSIAFCRLDTDWYESTKHIIQSVYPQVVGRGVVAIDDYGSWAGARKATDDYLQTLKYKPLLVRTGYSERVFVKPI